MVFLDIFMNEKDLSDLPSRKLNCAFEYFIVFVKYLLD